MAGYLTEQVVHNQYNTDGLKNSSNFLLRVIPSPVNTVDLSLVYQVGQVSEEDDNVHGNSWDSADSPGHLTTGDGR